eukprot:1202140-Rhodomonas_salina.1
MLTSRSAQQVRRYALSSRELLLPGLGVRDRSVERSPRSWRSVSGRMATASPWSSICTASRTRPVTPSICPSTWRKPSLERSEHARMARH